jgi:hypothetical protein
VSHPCPPLSSYAKTKWTKLDFKDSHSPNICFRYVHYIHKKKKKNSRNLSYFILWMIFPWKRFHIILFEEISTKLYIASLLNLKLKKKKITVRTNIFPIGNSNSYASLDQDNSTSRWQMQQTWERERGGERERVKLSCWHIQGPLTTPH